MQEIQITERLGNFYSIAVTYNGVTVSNSEAAYQSQKIIHDPDLVAQFTTLSGDQAFRMARKYASNIRSDWLKIRVQVMKEVLAAKVAQNSFILCWLFATDDSLLVDHNPVTDRDAFWSDDFDGTGKNVWGTLWMQLRFELRGESKMVVDPSGYLNDQKFVELQK